MGGGLGSAGTCRPAGVQPAPPWAARGGGYDDGEPVYLDGTLEEDTLQLNRLGRGNGNTKVNTRAVGRRRRARPPVNPPRVRATHCRVRGAVYTGWRARRMPRIGCRQPDEQWDQGMHGKQTTEGRRGGKLSGCGRRARRALDGTEGKVVAIDVELDSGASPENAVPVVQSVPEDFLPQVAVLPVANNNGRNHILPVTKQLCGIAVVQGNRVADAGGGRECRGGTLGPEAPAGGRAPFLASRACSPRRGIA